MTEEDVLGVLAGEWPRCIACKKYYKPWRPDLTGRRHLVKYEWMRANSQCWRCTWEDLSRSAHTDLVSQVEILNPDR